MRPAGFKRSRALWDLAQEQRHRCNGLWRAVMYELQPVRYSEFVVYRDSIVQSSQTALSSLLVVFGRVSLPAAAQHTAHYVRTMSFGQWKMLAGAITYYIFVRWIHAALDAGPLVLIVSALVAIFTIGLSDEGSDGLSAYSVFNKGFQKIMGSVDADALLQQHIGGGIMLPPLNMFPPQQHEGGRDRIDELPPARMPQRPRQQQQRPGAAMAREQQQEGGDDGEVENDRPPPPNNNNRARKTGKKARRGNAIEQRRELRAQREAAIAMGFGAGGDEVVAMHRLIEDQVAGGEGDDEQ